MADLPTHPRAWSRSFQDALALPYGWTPSAMPSECVCSQCISVEHAVSCPRGDFPSLCHNNIRDLTASLLSEVCSSMAVEPELQQLIGEKLHGGTVNRNNDARVDVAADGF